MKAATEYDGGRGARSDLSRMETGSDQGLGGSPSSSREWAVFSLPERKSRRGRKWGEGRGQGRGKR